MFEIYYFDSNIFQSRDQLQNTMTQYDIKIPF